MDGDKVSSPKLIPIVGLIEGVGVDGISLTFLIFFNSDACIDCTGVGIPGKFFQETLKMIRQKKVIIIEKDKRIPKGGIKAMIGGH